MTIRFEDGKIHGKPRVYLAGGMENAKNWGQGWREELTPWLESLGYEAYNPMEAQNIVLEYSMEQLKELKNNNMSLFMKQMSKIVEEDLKQLSLCEAVVCLLDESVLKGAGTYGELTYCANNSIPVFALIDLPNGAKDLPGWCLGCITYYEESLEKFKASMDNAYTFMLDKRKKKQEAFDNLTKY